MRISWTWVILVAGCGASAAWAQGTTVQLPTYRTFQSNGAVLVPDQGGAYLGGVKRARSGRNEFGSPFRPFGNRSIGSDLSATGTSVSAHIHDFAAMEEELQRAATGSSRAVAGSGDPRRALARDRRRAVGEAPPPSLEEIRRQRRLDEEARQAEARDFFARGQAAEESGKANVARVYYQIAAKRASGSFRDEVLARLDSLRRGQAPEIARQGP